MAKYKMIKVDEVPNYASKGEMRMFRKVIDSDQVTLSYRRLPAGFKSAHGHTHSKLDEIIFVFKGQLKLRLDDDVIEVGPLSAVKIAPQVKRGYHNEGSEDVEMVVVSAQGSLVGDNGGTPDDNWWN